MTREEVLQGIATARALAQTVLESGTRFAQGQIPTAIEMLDAIDGRVRAEQWPPPEGTFDDVRIGLYAVRHLEEIDGGRLSTVLCRLDNALKGRGPG